LIKEGISQKANLFPDAPTDFSDLLQVVHGVIGVRTLCRLSNKIFLKVLKARLLELQEVENWKIYISQVLYDLHGIKFSPDVRLEEHQPIPDGPDARAAQPLDRRTAAQLMDFVMDMATKMPMKDLAKSELKATIDKMQQAIGSVKINAAMSYNLRNYTQFLKTSINPSHLYQAIKGNFELDSVPVASDYSQYANKGWYLLLGNIALTKFRSQKRVSAGPTDDLNIAASFFRLQLQFTSDSWETWYRLAQCFDFVLEEDVLWSADKLNNARSDLVHQQRSAIHCYTVAISTALRYADDSPETRSKISDMYTDFGMRIYASTREPFCSEALWADEFQRHFTSDWGMYKKPAHSDFNDVRAWKFASVLFKRAIVDKPNYWMYVVF
jgi:hypothetical protein